MERLVLESKIDLTFPGSTVVGLYLVQDIGSFDEKMVSYSFF